jgi:hypothetical protein
MKSSGPEEFIDQWNDNFVKFPFSHLNVDENNHVLDWTFLITITNFINVNFNFNKKLWPIISKHLRRLSQIIVQDPDSTHIEVT